MIFSQAIVRIARDRWDYGVSLGLWAIVITESESLNLPHKMDTLIV